MKIKQIFLVLFLFLFSNFCYSAQLAPPTLIAPVNGAQNVSTSLQGFSWNPVTGATTYRIVVVEPGHFSEFIDSGATSSCNNTVT